MRRIAVLAWASLWSAAAWGQAEICEPLKGIAEHAGADFLRLRAKQTHSSGGSNFVDAVLTLPRAEKCWISERGDGLGRYRCSWRPASAPAITAELRTFADGVAKCFPDARLDSGRSADEWWLSLPEAKRVYMKADKDTMTIDLVIFRARWTASALSSPAVGLARRPCA